MLLGRTPPHQEGRPSDPQIYKNGVLQLNYIADWLYKMQP